MTRTSPSSRAARRRAARNTGCSLCFEPMTHHDRQPYQLGPAHPRCITRQARADAAQVQAKLDQIEANAASTMAAIATQHRAQAMGLWLPGQQ